MGPIQLMAVANPSNDLMKLKIEKHLKPLFYFLGSLHDGNVFKRVCLFMGEGVPFEHCGPVQTCSLRLTPCPGPHGPSSPKPPGQWNLFKLHLTFNWKTFLFNMTPQDKAQSMFEAFIASNIRGFSSFASNETNLTSRDLTKNSGQLLISQSVSA